MGKRATAAGQHLTVARAAEALGVSRLKVRDAIARGVLPARRDNHGLTRVDVAEGVSLEGGAASGPALVDALFDEVEELSAALAAREEQDVRLADLLARQDAALGRALDLLQRGGTGESPSPDAAAARELDQLQTVRQENERLTALLERAFAALEASAGPEAAELKRERLRGAAADVVTRDRRLAPEGEAAGRLEAMLKRALEGAERLEREVASRDAAIAEREAALEQVLSLSERSLAAATSKADARQHVGFWRRLARGRKSE